MLDGGYAAAYAILGYVTLQRLVELLVARRNTRHLLARGAREAAPGHYPLIVLLHGSWLGALWVLSPGEPISLPLLVLFAVVQVLRFWTLASLGRRWTTRIIVVPGETLVRRGPYRFLSHPNYLVVALEVALLPAVFGLHAVVVLFSLLNAAVLAVRIRAESRALAGAGSAPEARTGFSRAKGG